MPAGPLGFHFSYDVMPSLPSGLISCIEKIWPGSLPGRKHGLGQVLSGKAYPLHLAESRNGKFWPKSWGEKKSAYEDVDAPANKMGGREGGVGTWPVGQGKWLQGYRE